MGNRIKDIERSSPMAQMAMHPLVLLPPVAGGFFSAAVPGSAYVGPFPQTLVVANRTFGGACNVHMLVQGATAANFNGSRSVTYRITGTDENHEPQVEMLLCVGQGVAAPQHFPGRALWSRIETIEVAELTGGPFGAETFSIGVGGGLAAQLIRIPNMAPGLHPSQWRLVNVAVGTTTQTPASIAPAEDADPALRYRSVQVSNFPGTVQAGARLCVVVFAGVDAATIGDL